MSIKLYDGFTLFELLITISILAIIISIALPSFQDQFIKQEIQSTQTKLSRAIQMARQQAMGQTHHVVICGADNTKQCTNDSWSHGFLVFTDQNNNRLIDQGETIFLIEMLDLNYGELTWRSLNRNNLSFIPRTGLPLGSNGTFSYCAQNSELSYSLVVSQMGHSRIAQTQRCD